MNLTQKFIISTFSTIISLTIIVPITQNIQDLMHSDSMSLDYDVIATKSGFSNPSTQIVENRESKNQTKQQEYLYNFKLSGETNIINGNITKMLIVYSANGDTNFSDGDLKLVKQKINENWGSYFARIFPFVNPNKHPLKTMDWSLSLFFSDKSETVDKPIYLVTLDENNKIDITLLGVPAQYDEINKSSSPLSIVTTINLSGMLNPTASPSFFTTEDFLKAQDKLTYHGIQPPVSPVQFKKNITDIKKLASDYFSQK